MKLENNELKTYIKKVLDLETAVYAQENEINAAKGALDNKPEPPQIRSIHVEHKHAKEVKKPELPDFSGYKFELFIKAVMIGIVVSFIAYMVFTSSSIVYACDIVVFLCYIFKRMAEKDIFEEKEKQLLEEYNNQLKEAKKLQEEYDLEYKVKSKDAEEKATLEFKKKQKEYENDIILYDDSLKEISKMTETLTDTKKILRQAYEYNVIFPKYRNLIAISSFYEYLESGRCNELEGKNGAYNLYESELRMNVIISNLDTIVHDLNSIRQNQYILYQTLQKTHEQVYNIEEYTANLLDSSKHQKAIEKINSHLNDLAVRNTEMIKGLMIYNTLK